MLIAITTLGLDAFVDIKLDAENLNSRFVRKI